MASSGDGWAVASLDEMGEGPGFRKVRHEVGVTAFGVNAIVLPAGYPTPRHNHDEQEELYFVHAGEIEISFGDGAKERLGPGVLSGVVAEGDQALDSGGP